jgi:hypothetical protein
VALPVSLLGAWLFSQLFEIPFKRYRSWKSLIALGRSYGTGRNARDRRRPHEMRPHQNSCPPSADPALHDTP